LKELGDDVLDIMISRAETMRSPMSMVGFFHMHGAVTRIDRDATAYSLRDDQWDYDVISQWTDPVEAAHHVQWTRDYWTAVEPYASGEVYVNHLDAEETARMQGAYAHNYDRLVALKNKFDPNNLFRMNQNIKPTV
jgi:FAD/FMN-containing dehydrogenase